MPAGILTFSITQCDSYRSFAP